MSPRPGGRLLRDVLEFSAREGSPAFGLYREAPGGFMPAGVHVLGIERGRITSITAFMEPLCPAAWACRRPSPLP